MTKPYHITPEQAEELWFATDNTLTTEFRIRAFANAVLDEVLGDPVAWRYSTAQESYRYRGYVPNFDKEYETLKPIALYAPRNRND